MLVIKSIMKCSVCGNCLDDEFLILDSPASNRLCMFVFVCTVAFCCCCFVCIYNPCHIKCLWNAWSTRHLLAWLANPSKAKHSKRFVCMHCTHALFVIEQPNYQAKHIKTDSHKRSNIMRIKPCQELPCLFLFLCPTIPSTTATYSILFYLHTPFIQWSIEQRTVRVKEQKWKAHDKFSNVCVHTQAATSLTHWSIPRLCARLYACVYNDDDGMIKGNWFFICSINYEQNFAFAIVLAASTWNFIECHADFNIQNRSGSIKLA